MSQEQEAIIAEITRQAEARGLTVRMKDPIRARTTKSSHTIGRTTIRLELGTIPNPSSPDFVQAYGLVYVGSCEICVKLFWDPPGKPTRHASFADPGVFDHIADKIEEMIRTRGGLQ